MVTRTFTLGRYTCVERLATGPVGELWRAKRFGLVGVERQFLLTRLHGPLGKDVAGLGRLQAALKTYGELDVDGVLHFQEQGTQGSDVYVVLDFPGFADLRKLRPGLELVVETARQGALWPQIVAAVGRSLAATLTQLHERGIFHGLLSPASIWIDPLGRVQLSDLGLAQVLPTQAWATDANLKPLYPYLPKEVQSGTAPGTGADVFALGAILVELLAAGPVGPESKGLADSLRALCTRATSNNRAERPATMRDFSRSLDSLTLSAGQLEAVRQVLVGVAMQFRFTGDSVPQAVTISERSSAEPLPPPPGARSGDSKVGSQPASARYRVSSVPEKPAKSPPSRPMSGQAKAAEPPASDGRVVPQGESEDTPLPASRPLLVTNPKIQASSPDDSGRRRADAAAKSGEDKSAGRPAEGGASRPRSSRDNIKTGAARSGIDWLTSQSDQVTVDPNAAAAAKEPAPAPARKSSTGPQTPARPASTPPKRRSNPVSVNPRASSGQGGSASANTPTAEVDVAEASSELGPVGQPASQAKGSGKLRQVAAALSAEGVDRLSLGETNPQLPPVKAFPQNKKQLGDEPTNPVSLESVARAAAEGEAPAEGAAPPASPKRRSGPISGPSPRVLSNTAPAEIVPGSPAEAAGPDVLGNTGLAAPVPPSGSTEDFAVRPKRPRPLVVAGGIGALLLACGIVYLLAASSTHHGTGGPGGTAPAVAEAGAGPPPPPPLAPDTLVLAVTPAAEVFIDGESKGKAPLTLKLAAGKHKMVLVADEYSLVRRDVMPGNKLDIKLEQAKLPDDMVGDTALKVKCKSEGKLRILVDSHDTGRTCPTDDLSLAPGKYVFSFLDPATDELKEKKVKVKKAKKPVKVKVKF